jgi:ribonucleoside-diphosphate reductase alpha chain
LDYFFNNYRISIDYTRDSLLSEAGIAIMKDRYLLPEEKSPQECFARAACSFATNELHAQRLYDYASKCWMMFSTPILSNAGTKRGLPISCFLNYVDDSMEGILDHYYESGFLASYGGGIGGDWSALRPAGSKTSRGNTSTGLIPFVKMADAQMLAVQQGSTRRGAYAAYLDVSHPEVEEFLNIRTAQGSDANRRCLGAGFHHGLNIPDKFMEAVREGLPWDLVDPNTGMVKKSLPARELWMSILIKRLETGEPYLHFSDNSNDDLPKFLKDKGLRINNSNLCTEIMLPTSKDRTAVCCLSSVNLEYFDDWKDEKWFLFDIAEMLDNVLEYFINNAPKSMWRAVNSAKNERSIGVGSMGFALYLQKKRIPFESAVAIGVNRKIYKHMQEKLAEANNHLGTLRGPAPDAATVGKRFSHTMAIAPNASISLICGNTSPSIEPYNANAFKQQTMSGSFLIKNKALESLLREYYEVDDKDLEDIWADITINNGSVQHIKWMVSSDKLLFKTAMELDQTWIIEHAAKRQPFIDQGQSVNLFLYPNIHKTDLHKLHFSAWSQGLKSLYYVRSEAIEKVKSTPLLSVELKVPPKEEVEVEAFTYEDEAECVACEG